MCRRHGLSIFIAGSGGPGDPLSGHAPTGREGNIRYLHGCYPAVQRPTPTDAAAGFTLAVVDAENASVITDPPDPVSQIMIMLSKYE